MSNKKSLGLNFDIMADRENDVDEGTLHIPVLLSTETPLRKYFGNLLLYDAVFLISSFTPVKTF